MDAVEHAREERASHAARPIIVGEVRGGEAIDMLQAVNRGFPLLA
jgi:type IV secretory pathway ATPase VirB11/archaellum biosynthesis ATPase